MKERRAIVISGWILLTGVATLIVLLAVYDYTTQIWNILFGGEYDGLATVVVILTTFFSLIIMAGFFIVQPKEAVVFQFLGHYAGTVNGDGLQWTIPFVFTRRYISKRLRNFESAIIKVNDANGNPVHVSTVVEWRVVDSAKAIFEVDQYRLFVEIQSEAALRSLVMKYPYESFDANKIALMTHTTEIVDELQRMMQQRFDKIGVEVFSAQISTLTYAPEIANLMLQRQQAKAVVAARKEIVDGAVGMVDDALRKLTTQRVCSMTEHQKAQMVSNLMAVLCSSQQTQPVLDLKTD